MSRPLGVDNHIAEPLHHGDASPTASFISAISDTPLIQEVCKVTPTSTSTQRVFAIPELVEEILSGLKYRDVLQAERVNKTFHEVVETSPHLQRRLCLRVDSHGPFKLLARQQFFDPSDLYYFSSNAEDHHKPLDQRTGRFIFTVYPTGAGSRRNHPIHRPLARLPEKMRRMFISQPPVTSMECWWVCCFQGLGAYADGEEIDKGIEVRRDDGVRLGDLWDKAVDLLKTHTSLAHEGVLFDSNRLSVSFRGAVELPRAKGGRATGDGGDA